MTKLKQESRYTKISITILCLLSVSVLLNFFNLPLRMSRLCWLILMGVSLVLSFLGKRETKTMISIALLYINVFILGISLIVFKTILSLIKIVF